MDWLKAHSAMQVDWRLKWLAVPHDRQTHILQGLLPSSPQQLLLQVDLLIGSSSNSKPPSNISSCSLANPYKV